MNQSLNKYYFIASIFVHMFIFFAISYMIKRDSISNKNFVIFGAHSRIAAKATYKSGNITPFTGTPTGRVKSKTRNSSSKNRNRSKKKQIGKKVAARTKKQTPTKKIIAQKISAQKTEPLHKAAKAVMPLATAMIEDEVISQPKKKKQLKKKLKLEQTKPVPAPIEENIIVPHQESLPEEAPVPSAETPEQIIDNGQAEDDDDEDDDAIHIGIVDATDPVTRYHQRVVSQEFNRLWQPPVGVRKGTECSVKIILGKSNTIESIDFIKRSNIPIYDLSILRLKLAKFSFPESLQGKKLIVVFHQ